MLLELTIRNIALIESLRIEFAQGFNVLTGETGAGKSIVVDCVNLALGGRADRDMIRTGAERGSVEALFDISENAQALRLAEELAEKLKNHGVKVTQATVSRDIKELRLLKVLSENGGYKYATVERAEKGLNERFIRILTESIVNMEAVGNLMVIKTLSASAAAACEAIDSMKWNEVLGTIAGDNTVLIIGRSPEAIEIVQNRFHNLLKR